LVVTLLLLLGSAALIYVGCEFFVNGVEWVGQKLGIAQNAVGTVLAAFGTALPESVVTFVAVVMGTSSEAKDVGVGAALGGPLVLATVAYAATGWSILLFRRRRSQGGKLLIDGGRLARDQVAFLVIFVVKVVLGFVAFPGKPFTGFLFLAAYGVYFWRELRQQSAEVEGDLEPLRIRPRQTDPHPGWVFLQTGLALAAVFVGSQVFVGQLEGLAVGLGVPGHIIALLLSPVATELPETMNAIIWVRQGKERLALANISGAMMIQATVPSALGLLFTPWRFDTALALAGAATMLAIVYLILTLRSAQLTAGRLALVGLGYVAFAGVFIATR
jgi:cation:H+ antiporter